MAYGVIRGALRLPPLASLPVGEAQIVVAAAEAAEEAGAEWGRVLDVPVQGNRRAPDGQPLSWCEQMS
jgi:hypothetical protein